MLVRINVLLLVLINYNEYSEQEILIEIQFVLNSEENKNSFSNPVFMISMIFSKFDTMFWLLSQEQVMSVK